MNQRYILRGLAILSLACSVPQETPTDEVETEWPCDSGEEVPPPRDFSWTITLIDGDRDFDVDADGDGFLDVDGDTLESTIQAAPEGDWEFGWAQTALGAHGWFGEDCNGIDSIGYDICFEHPRNAQGDGTLTLTQTDIHSLHQGVNNSLIRIDFPESMTPPMTYLLTKTDGSDCYVVGDDVAYYASMSCTTYTGPIPPAM